MAEDRQSNSHRSEETHSHSSLLIRRLRFEHLISRLSSRFVRMGEHFDEDINWALKEIGETSGAGRAYIFMIAGGDGFLTNTHEWCREGVPALQEDKQRVALSDYPWLIAEMEADRVMHVSHISQLENVAPDEMVVLVQQKVRSLLVLPIRSNGKLIGMIGFDNLSDMEDWSPDDVTMIRVGAELVGHAFGRARVQAELRSRNEELQETLENLRLLQTRLISRERMAGIGQLAAGIAHEINNPLAVITSNFDILMQYVRKIRECAEPLSGISDAEPAYKEVALDRAIALSEKHHIKEILSDTDALAEDVRESLARVSAIIGHLRRFAHIDAPEGRMHTDINALILGICEMERAAMEAVAVIEVDLGELPLILAEPRSLNPAVMGVIRNAMEAVHDRHGSGRGRIVIRTWQERDRVCIQVEDNGTGIPEHVMPDIFNPFFTTRPVGKGSGLGLTIAYDVVVHQHQGQITASSEDGQGTTVRITLPLHPDRQSEVHV